MLLNVVLFKSSKQFLLRIWLSAVTFASALLGTALMQTKAEEYHATLPLRREAHENLILKGDYKII
jgi:hypothetical protein